MILTMFYAQNDKTLQPKDYRLFNAESNKFHKASKTFQSK